MRVTGFTDIRQLRKWLDKENLISGNDLFVCEEIEDSDSNCPQGTLWINPDFSPQTNDCVDIINYTLSILNEKSENIKEIQCSGYNKADCFFLAKFGMSNNKCLIIKDYTLENLKSNKFNIEVVEIECTKCKYKLIVTVTNANGEVKEIAYDLNLTMNTRTNSAKIKLDDIKCEIVNMLSNYCNVYPKEIERYSDRYYEEHKKKIILEEVLRTEFMKVFLRQINNYLINPFAVEMQNCLPDKKDNEPTSISVDSQKNLLDNTSKFYKYLKCDKNLEHDKYFKNNENKELNDEEKDIIWLVRMSMYLNLLSTLIKNGASEEKHWPDKKELDSRNVVSFRRLLEHIETVKGYICDKNIKDTETFLDKMNENISHERPRKKGKCVKETVIDKEDLDFIKKTLKKFIVKHKKNWDMILMYRLVFLHNKGSLNLMAFNEIIAHAYLSNCYVYNNITAKLSPSPLSENASSI